MRDKTEKTIAKYSLLNSGDKVIVALSGGADSVALFHLIYSLKEKYNLTIYAAHVNHLLRGEESRRDEEYVKFLCEKYNIQLFVRHADVGALAKEQKISTELCGRNVRYSFFDELSSKTGAKIATAHTASDNTETLLFNIARGCGINGLCAIPPRRNNIIRPLIEVTREQTERYCLDNSLDFVTDSTNMEDDYNRNRIRHSVIPVLRGINPSLDSTVSLMSESFVDIVAFFDKYSTIELNNYKTAYGYDVQKLLMLEPAVLDFALIKLVKDSGSQINRKQLSMLKDAMKNKGAVTLSKSVTADCSQNILRIVNSGDGSAENQVDLQCDCFADDIRHSADIADGILLNEFADKEYFSTEELKEINKKFLNDCISCDIITGSTLVRTRRAGDTFTFSDRGITKSVKKLLCENKVPRELRDSLLLVANGSTVLWLQGVGTSLHGEISAHTKRAVRITRG